GLPPQVFGAEGTQRRQFRFGALGYPTFIIFSTTPGTIVVDNLRVWRLDAEAVRATPPIFAFGYPRLGNYFFGSPYGRALASGLPVRLPAPRQLLLRMTIRSRPGLRPARIGD